MPPLAHVSQPSRKTVKRPTNRKEQQLHAAYLLNWSSSDLVLYYRRVSAGGGGAGSRVFAEQTELRLFFFLYVGEFTQPSPRRVSALVRATNSFPI